MRIAFFEQEQMETVVDLLHEMSGHYNGDRPSDRWRIRQNLTDNILGPESGVRLLLAVDEGRAVALASIAILYPAVRERGQLFLKELFVASSHRGRGIGTQLIRYLANYALGHNCARLDWTVDCDNEGALEFYAGLGATPAPDKVYFRVAGDDLAALAGLQKGARDVISTERRDAMTSNIGIARDLYAAFGRGDMEAVLAMFDPDIQWKPAEGHPYQQDGAAWIGPKEVLDNLFVRIGTEWDRFTVTVGTLHDAGDHVVMEGRYTGTFKPSGRTIDAQVCHVLHFRNGKLCSFHQYMDTAQLQAAMAR